MTMNSQQQYKSRQWGTVDFIAVTGKGVNTKCRHCILCRNSEDCTSAPCSPEERQDGQHGYYTIHQMPTGLIG
jgi:hypothetical protein